MDVELGNAFQQLDNMLSSGNASGAIQYFLAAIARPLQAPNTNCTLHGFPITLTQVQGNAFDVNIAHYDTSQGLPVTAGGNYSRIDQNGFTFGVFQNSGQLIYSVSVGVGAIKAGGCLAEPF